MSVLCYYQIYFYEQHSGCNCDTSVRRVPSKCYSGQPHLRELYGSEMNIQFMDNLQFWQTFLRSAFQLNSLSKPAISVTLSGVIKLKHVYKHMFKIC